jgi:hypothetical protein
MGVIEMLQQLPSNQLLPVRRLCLYATLLNMRGKLMLFAILALYRAAVPVPQVYAAARGEFLLKITVIDPGAKADLRTRIAPRKPFEWSETHNNTKITIKGELSATQKGKYHLQLTLAEWKDPENNNIEKYEVDLTPGKPESRGFVSSFLYRRTILLTNVPKP